jgi:hypothetical protein
MNPGNGSNNNIAPEAARTSQHQYESEPGPSSNSNQSSHHTAAGGGDDGGRGDSDDSDDDGDADDNNNNHHNNDNNNDRPGPSQPRQAGNPRQQPVYRSGRYKGLLRYRAAMHYSPATFVFVTDVGNLTVECNHCHALKFDGEKPGICCNNGKVNVPTPIIPPELVPLLNGESPLSIPYLKNIQQYNNLVNFTSFAANQQFITNRNGQRQWTPGFKVLGQIYHRIGPLFPNPGQPAAHLQMYFLSEDEQFQRRSSIFEGLNIDIIRHNSELMNTYNPYVAEFKSAISTIRNSNIPNLKVNISHYLHIFKFYQYWTQMINQRAVALYFLNMLQLLSGHNKRR